MTVLRLPGDAICIAFLAGPYYISGNNSLEVIKMGSIEDPHQKHKKSRQELRTRMVGNLLRIIEELEDMDLSVREIETIVRTCGLNADCAMRFAAEKRHEKEKGHLHIGKPKHQ